ncbi:hypothetical protein [Streptomyces sp. NPDC059761]|uniref:hypothetical protein n=1 Tax=Streptomyces sp. NPDC059761 TaxID=3346937 RepID=UPI00365FF090
MNPLLAHDVAGPADGPALQKVVDAEDALLEAGDVAGAVELMVDTWLGPSADEAARALASAPSPHPIR